MNELIAKLELRRAKVMKRADDAIANATRFNRGLSQGERIKFDKATAEANAINKRIAELKLIEARDEASREASTFAFGTARVTDRGSVYERDNHGGPSFFRDLYTSRTHQDRDALKRLEKNNRQVADARKASGNKAEARAINTTFGSGGKVLAAV